MKIIYKIEIIYKENMGINIKVEGEEIKVWDYSDSAFGQRGE